MKSMLNKYVYTFKDLVMYGNESIYNPWTFVPATYILNIIKGIAGESTSFVDVFKEVFTIEDNEIELDEYCAELLNFVYNDNEAQVCMIFNQKESPTSAEFESERSLFLHTFINKLNVTAPRYKSILSAYKSKENQLLGEIHSRTTGISRFNDTPQEEGDFASDEHTTNISQNEGHVYSDGSTAMSRLNEIQEQYRNLIQDWAKEFICFFISQYNYEEEK